LKRQLYLLLFINACLKILKNEAMAACLQESFRHDLKHTDPGYVLQVRLLGPNGREDGFLSAYKHDDGIVHMFTLFFNPKSKDRVTTHTTHSTTEEAANHICNDFVQDRIYDVRFGLSRSPALEAPTWWTSRQ
jgi:hypothetical protein